MPTVSYFALPAGSAAGGDVVYATSDSIAILRPHTADVLEYASRLSGKFDIAFGIACRFEVDLPAGATFVGARLNLWVFTTTGAGSKAGTFGIQDHDVDGEWTGSDGWSDAAYVLSGDLERPVISASFFDTAYYADAGHRISEDVADYGADDRFGIATGSLSGEVILSSLLSELQAWFDGKELLRDTGVGDGIPISFALASDNPAPHRGFNFYDSNASHGALRPSLDLDYEIPGHFTARMRTKTTMAARVATATTMAARIATKPTMTARIRTEPTMSARIKTKTTIAARGGTR